MVEQVDLGAGENSFIRAWMLNDVTICDKLINHFENVGETHVGEVIGETGAEVKKEIKDFRFSSNCQIQSTLDLTLFPSK